jgi:hypothetical protein
MLVADKAGPFKADEHLERALSIQSLENYSERRKVKQELRKKHRNLVHRISVSAQVL